jgi:uncharacterized protein DUF3617
MKAVSRWYVAAALSLFVTTVILAQTPALDVKMGLWEVTTAVDINGQMPGVDTSKMTPEQKARMEAAMQGLTGAHAVKSCMTKEKFDRSNFMTMDQPGMTCKQTITTNTRTTLEASVVCTGAGSRTSQIHLDALSSTSFKGYAKSSNAEQGRSMTVNVAMTGKWLGADCGDTK